MSEGRGLPESLIVETVPVVHAAVHDTDMDEIEVVDGPRPVLIDVVNLEYTVGWDVCGLDRRKIHAADLGAWVFICKFPGWC